MNENNDKHHGISGKLAELTDTIKELTEGMAPLLAKALTVQGG